MEIKERIENIGEYFVSLNVASENNIIYVRVVFPKGWGCSEVTEHNFDVKCVKDEIPGYFYFFADMNVGFSKIFDAIEYNIQFNEEAQAKVTLLREKIEELKNLFETEDINVLKTLEFKVKKKKNITKKIKHTEENTEITEEITDSVEDDNIDIENTEE